MQPYTRRCAECRKARDADDLYANEKSTTCLLCDNRKASFTAKAERTARRIKERQTRATKARSTLSEAERYRRTLQKHSPYTAAEIERYVRLRFGEEVHP